MFHEVFLWSRKRSRGNYSAKKRLLLSIFKAGNNLTKKAGKSPFRKLKKKITTLQSIYISLLDGCVPNISAMAFKGFLKRIGITFFHVIAALTTPLCHYTDRTKIN